MASTASVFAAFGLKRTVFLAALFDGLPIMAIIKLQSGSD
jgi:hypothetical protein